jgi:hypothetical protein
MLSVAATLVACQACTGLAQMIASTCSFRSTAVSIPATGVSLSNNRIANMR